MLMMAAAYVTHLFVHWSYRFSKSESYWAGAALDAHKKVDHKVCLEKVEMNARNELRIITDREPICSGL